MDIRKALLVKSLRELLAITACLSHNNKRKPRISKRKRFSWNLPYVEGNSEKLRRILRSHKIRFTFYFNSTLRKLLCIPKDRVATEDKKNIVYETAVTGPPGPGGSKWSLKSRSNEHKRSNKNCDCDKNEIAKHSLKSPSHFNKISYMLPRNMTS